MGRNRNRTWLWLAALTLATALIWVGASAAATFRKSTVSQDVEQETGPLDPNIDMSVFTKLQQRNAR